VIQRRGPTLAGVLRPPRRLVLAGASRPRDPGRAGGTAGFYGRAVQNAMIGPDDSLAGGLPAALTLVVSSRLIARSAWLRGGLEGKPTLLVTRARCRRMIFGAKASP
jgi:hypothetical protein